MTRITLAVIGATLSSALWIPAAAEAAIRNER